MMRVGTMALLAMALAGCSAQSDEEQAAEQADLANYTPPFVMSRLDYGGVIERRLRRLDANGDDRLVPGELPQRARERIMKLDANGDGAVDADEWSTGMLDRFDAQDANHDGTLTSDERERARAQQAADLPTPADEPTGNVATVR